MRTEALIQEMQEATYLARIQLYGKHPKHNLEDRLYLERLNSLDQAFSWVLGRVEMDKPPVSETL